MSYVTTYRFFLTTAQTDVWAGVLVFLLISTHAEAASFDCEQAQTEVEKLICADIDLSSLDEELAQAYLEAGKRTAEPERFKREQLAWLKERGECLERGKPLACLTAMYRERVQALAGDCWWHESWNTGMGSAKYITSGENEPICQLMLENLNRFCSFDPKTFQALESRIDPRISSLSTVDWTHPRNEAAMVDWLKEAVRWARYPYRKEPDEWSWDIMRDEAITRLKSGTMRIFEAKFDLTNDGVPELVRWADYGGDLRAGDEKWSFGGGTGMALTDPVTGMPDKRVRYYGFVVFNSGTTYLLKGGATEARLTRPFTSSRNGRLPREEWKFGESTICEFRRKED